MPNMLEQVLRNVGELGLMKRPVKSQQIGGYEDTNTLRGAEGEGVPAAEGAPPAEGQVETEFQRRKRVKQEQEKAADAQFYSITEQMDPDAAATFNSLYTMAKATRDPAAPVKVATQAAGVLTRKGTQAADIDKLKATYPDDADFIEQHRGQPAGVISSLASQLSAERIAGRKEKKEGGYRIPREGLDPAFAGMTDADVSDLMKEKYKEEHAPKGDDVYPRLKGTSLKIMNDDTFKRSGLKTGDKVCIQIP